MFRLHVLKRNYFIFLHQILDLDKGRKAVGGKMEILLKIREPFENKDTEIVNEKWLILDSHLRGLDMVSVNGTLRKQKFIICFKLVLRKSKKSHGKTRLLQFFVCFDCIFNSIIILLHVHMNIQNFYHIFFLYRKHHQKLYKNLPQMGN